MVDRRLVWVLIAAGLAVRVVLAFTTRGVPFDLNSYGVVSEGLRAHGLDVYSAVNAGRFPRWPYPPGMFPVILGAQGAHDLTGASLAGIIRLPSIAADLAIAWIVQDFIGRRGFGPRSRLGAAALVALGPSFIAISGFHGQIDSVAILPAVGALAVWDRPHMRHRAIVAGTLIGIGAGVKTIPILMLLALLPSARSRREGLVLAGSAIAVLAVAVLPFALADPAGVSILGRYRGAVGLGGASLAAQPNLALGWLGVAAAPISGVSRWLQAHGSVITALALAASGGALLYRRTSAVPAALAVWLTIYVFGVNFFMQYMVWGLPFLIMAGYLRWALALEAVLLVPTVLTYAHPRSTWLAWLGYVVPMLAVWTSMVGGLLLLGYAIARRRTLGGAVPAPDTLSSP